MKYKGLLLITVILCGSSLFSQYRKSITVKAGEDIAQSFSPNGFYRFAQFSNAALYNNKRSGPSDMLFNYNILTDRMQFINNNNDTLDMMNPTLFDSFIIEKTIFYYKEEGFLELVGTAWPIRLVKKTDIKMKPETVGAYGTSNTTSAVDRMKAFMVGNNVYNYRSNENMVIKTMVDWYWIGENGNLLKATKKNLFALLSPEKSRTAENFIKENKIDFDREKDLIKLLVALR